MAKAEKKKHQMNTCRFALVCIKHKKQEDVSLLVSKNKTSQLNNFEEGEKNTQKEERTNKDEAKHDVCLKIRKRNAACGKHMEEVLYSQLLSMAFVLLCLW